MTGEFLQQFLRVIGKRQQDALIRLEATMKNDLSYNSLTVDDATELTLDRPLWKLLAASRAVH